MTIKSRDGALWSHQRQLGLSHPAGGLTNLWTGCAFGGRGAQHQDQIVHNTQANLTYVGSGPKHIILKISFLSLFVENLFIAKNVTVQLLLIK